MKVLRAEAMGMCFGVRDALAVTRQISRPQDVTIHGELVHNPKVLVELSELGFPQSGENNRDLVPPTEQILITAHGVSDRERERLTSAGKRLIDTTCPLVRRVHLAAQQLAHDGYHVLVIGREGHVEVRGIVEDLKSYDIVESVDVVRSYAHRRLGIVCQSTTPPHRAEQTERAIRRQNPHAEIRVIDTICQPTRERQTSVDQLIGRVDVMVVVGGRNSNNTRELAERCRSRGLRVHRVESAVEIDPAWFQAGETVGLTAGTSTLDETIEDVFQSLQQIEPQTSRDACGCGSR